MTEASVSFAGNLTDDPEPRHTDSGIARAMFRVRCRAARSRSRRSSPSSSVHDAVVPADPVGRDQAWRDGVEVAALDPFRGYATALRTQLPGAIRILDAFLITPSASAPSMRSAAASNSEPCTAAATATIPSTGSGGCCAGHRRTLS